MFILQYQILNVKRHVLLIQQCFFLSGCFFKSSTWSNFYTCAQSAVKHNVCLIFCEEHDGCNIEKCVELYTFFVNNSWHMKFPMIIVNIVNNINKTLGFEICVANFELIIDVRIVEKLNLLIPFLKKMYKQCRYKI